LTNLIGSVGGVFLTTGGVVRVRLFDAAGGIEVLV
jgi:hypothetical protein